MALSRSRAVAVLVLIATLALGVASSAVLAPRADARASVSTFTVVEGGVLVSHGAQEFERARPGDVLRAGDTIRTATDGTAEITYFEGSSVRLEAGTEIVVETLRTEADGGTVIGMMQRLGRTWHVVTKLITGSSRYEVRTPSSTATVRGTIFAVDVQMAADGPVATVTTSEGIVLHTANDPKAGESRRVRVAAGQESTKSASKPAEPVHAAPPTTLREAPERPHAPGSTNTPRPASDRADLRTTEGAGDLAKIAVPTKDRLKSSKVTAQREEKPDR